MGSAYDKAGMIALKTQKFEYRPLFIFEMANNHMGDVDHGLRIIREFHHICQDFDFNFGFKFQYRQLDSFIHPKFKDRCDIKYIKRFSETRLSERDFLRLREELQKCGFVAICTPFDEASVDLIEKHDYDIVKIASCSFTDWPLLERAAQADKPIIASTATATFSDIDNVVSFLEHRNKRFSLMHCVAEYPTALENQQLNQIDLLRHRYPEVEIGFSTHESPEDTLPVQLAVTKGVSLFEKHVAVPTEEYAVNQYSATPDQVVNWLQAARQAFDTSGQKEGRTKATAKELSDIKGLRRGVYSAKVIKADEELNANDLNLAIPVIEGQLTANDLSKYNHLTANKELLPGEAILVANLESCNTRKVVNKIVSQVRKFIESKQVVIPSKVDFEISHHYGIERVDDYGATIITIVNRDYCKKIIVQLPGQKHPEHMHKKKEETFLILAGSVNLGINGNLKKFNAGDVILVEPNVKHSFQTEEGVIFEEISSTHYRDDSYYTDVDIMNNKQRKTQLTHWIE